MHELSIAIRIVETVEEALVEEAGARVTSVTVRVGSMSGVVPEALAFAWEPATFRTGLAGSSLEIDFVEAVVFCPACCEQRSLPEPWRLCCPECQTATPQVVRGRELEVLSVEVLDAAENPGSSNRDQEKERCAGPTAP